MVLINRGTRRVDRVENRIADRNDPASLAPAVRRSDGADAVIDTSTYTGRQVEIAREFLSRRVHRWVHPGSAAVYADALGSPPREEEPIGGAAVWGQDGRDRSDADALLLAQDASGLCILRPPYLYGPGYDNDRETCVWSRPLRGRPVVLPSGGTTPLQFLHVADLARALARAAITGFPTASTTSPAAPP